LSVSERQGTATTDRRSEMPAAEARLARRVLVIEDDEGVAEIVGRALGEGFELTFAGAGGEGLELAIGGSYDLVLLDLLLPDLDGATLLKRLISARPEQQVLVLSAMSNVEAKVRCLDLGASDYLAKPFALQELVARVNARLREPRRTRQVSSDVVKLDLSRRVAISHGKPVALSKREFALLEHLMLHEGEVCTRKQLLESVWGYTFDPGTNIVDVYVRRLRTKLEDLPVETVRNVGYAFAPTQ
jgi:two-component system, OmpR family, response regulator